MTDQRSALKFRVPRLRPSVPPPRRTTTIITTPARRPPIQPSPPPPQPPTIRPQDTTPAPPSAPPLSVVPSPSLASTPPPSIRPQSTTPDPPSAPPLPIVSSPSPTPAPAAAPLPQEAPASPPTPPIRSLDTIPAPPPEPPVEPSPPPQDEPASTLVQAAPPSSPSQTEIQSRVSSHPPSPPRMSTQPRILAKPPSPSTRSQPTPEPSTPPQLQPSKTPSPPTSPKVKKLTETASNRGQKGTDYALNATPDEERHEHTSMELSSEHPSSGSHIKQQPRIKSQQTEGNHHENQEAISTISNIPNTPQTKTMISHPDDIIQLPKSYENPKPNGKQPPYFEETMGTKPTNQFLDEKPPIITLAGDNRGTSMHMGSGATKREKSIHIYRKYKVNSDEITDTTTDGEEKENDIKTDENKGKFEYINCNIQGINNSIVFNCSITERNPGVHLGFCNPENVKKPKRKYTKSMDMNKVKVNITPSHKHTIRRRCLRGLFMESSDSDPNDPQKPRRHGCRYICGDKSNKDDKTDVL